MPRQLDRVRVCWCGVKCVYVPVPALLTTAVASVWAGEYLCHGDSVCVCVCHTASHVPMTVWHGRSMQARRVHRRSVLMCVSVSHTGLHSVRGS